MNLRLWMVALFLLAAVGLLSGCATSSGDADPDPEDDTTMEDTDDGMVDEDDEEMMDERGPYQVAVEEGNKAKSAQMMADDALKEAMDLSGKLGALNVKGDSGTAMDNAQKVLDAKTTIEGALTTANEALAALIAAKEGADDDEAAKEELDTVIEDVRMNIAAIQAIVDATGTGSLKRHVEDVTGIDEDDLKTAADIGIGVAEAIEGALKDRISPTTTRPQISDSTDAEFIPEKDRDIRTDQLGMTFSEIVGSSNIEDMRIGATGGVLRS